MSNLFHKIFLRCNDWEVYKVAHMHMDYYGQRTSPTFTKIWYKCAICQRIDVRRKNGVYSFEEIEELYPKPNRIDAF